MKDIQVFFHCCITYFVNCLATVAPGPVGRNEAVEPRAALGHGRPKDRRGSRVAVAGRGQLSETWSAAWSGSGRRAKDFIVECCGHIQEAEVASFHWQNGYVLFLLEVERSVLLDT